MKTYKIYKFLGWFCFWLWIPFGVFINPTFGGLMFIVFIPLLIISDYLHKKQDKEYAERCEKEKEEKQKYNSMEIKRKELEKEIDELMLEKVKIELDLEKKRKDNNPIFTKLLSVQDKHATFDVMYESRRKGTETVEVSSERFQELAKLITN